MTLKSIKDREDILEYCGWTMKHIGSGTGRTVFELSDDLVLKVARNEAGRRQNEVEAGINHNICALTYQHSDNFDWCIMERVYPFEENKFDKLTGTTYLDRVIWCEFKAITKGHFEPEIVKLVEARYKSMSCNGWEERMGENEFSSKLVSLMMVNDLEAGDIVRFDSWGHTKNNPDKPILFDYGLSNAVWSECYKRHDVKLRVDVHEFVCKIIEPLDELDKKYLTVFVNKKPRLAEKVV